MLAHRLLGGGSSSLSVSCPSLGSVLIATTRAVSGAPLSGALNPLSSRTRKQRGKKKSLASSAAPDLFPDSLLASCGALTPSGCVHAANPSPLPVIDRSPSLSSQPPPAPASRQASGAGECWSAPILCAGISPLCPPHPCGCALLLGSEASPLRPPAVSAGEGAS